MFLKRFPRRLYSNTGPAMDLTHSQTAALHTFKKKLRAGHYNFETTACLCGEKKDRLISAIDRFGLNVRTVLCKQCGLMRTDPQMTITSLNNFYEEDYRLLYGGEERASDEFYEEQLKRGEHVVSFLNTHFSASSSVQLVFDIGCGAGGMLAAFHEAGCTAIGCDLGSTYLEYGRNKGLILEHGNSEVLSKYGKADLIMLNHVLEHFKDPVTEVRKISRILDDDGLIYIELPGILSIKETYGDLILYLQNAHLFHFTLKTLTALMSRAGFELVKGNQNIQALYRKSNLSAVRSGKLEYLRIINYLWRI